MHGTMKITEKALLCALLALALCAAATATPGVPHQFYGNVLLNGYPSPDGVFVTAKIGGATNAVTYTLQGTYGLSPGPVFYVQDPDGSYAGKTVEFFVAGIKAAEHVFENGGSTKLDLFVTCDGCADTGGDDGGTSGGGTSSGGGGGTSGGGSSGGGSSGGGGGGAFFSFDTGEPTAAETTGGAAPAETGGGACVPAWTCSEWTECINGVRKRVCVDANRCGDETLKPATEEQCETPEEELYTGAKPGFFGAITGALLGGGTATWISLIVLLGLIGGLYYLALRKRR